MGKNVLEYLDYSVKKSPEKIAFIDSASNTSFDELSKKAKKIATEIIKFNQKEINKPIAIYMDKSIDCISAFLGVAYSGNFYTPIDTKSPYERVKKIFSVLNPRVIITNQKNVSMLKEIGVNVHIIMVEDCLEINDYEIENIRRKVIDTDPLYVLFTSGSTGNPKGVTISHRSVIDYIEWITAEFGITKDTIFGNQAPFYFDNSILDIYCTLRNGCTTVIIPEQLFIFSKKLLDFIEEENINTIFWVPSALIGVANSGCLEGRDLKLEKVLFCGEVMPNKQLNAWRKNLPNALYANLYGPTEITDVCAYFIVDRAFSDEEPLPIGFPCDNTDILVFNDQNKLVKTGEVGELCVRGSSLSLGYYNDYMKSKEVFVQNPLNKVYSDKIYRTGDLVKYNDFGELIYVSRKDYQIKHMGHRIELGEIEYAAFSMNGVKRCCAIYNENEKKIVLFCVVEAVDEKEIYKYLINKIPRYMVPSVINIIGEMPMNANGKIDRVFLTNECLRRS